MHFAQEYIKLVEPIFTSDAETIMAGRAWCVPPTALSVLALVAASYALKYIIGLFRVQSTHTCTESVDGRYASKMAVAFLRDKLPHYRQAQPILAHL